jgi:hypothetical protein
MAQLERLDTLARQINEEHRAFLTTFRKTLEHAIKVGELLTQAKEQCPYGKWLPWLEGNFEGAARTAQDYMRLYKGRDKIRANARDSAHFSVSGALKEIAASERPEGTPPESKNVGLTQTRVVGELNWGPDRSTKREGASEHDTEEDREPGVEAGEEPTAPPEQLNGERSEEKDDYDYAQAMIVKVKPGGDEIVEVLRAINPEFWVRRGDGNTLRYTRNALVKAGWQKCTCCDGYGITNSA